MKHFLDTIKTRSIRDNNLDSMSTEKILYWLVAIILTMNTFAELFTEGLTTKNVVLVISNALYIIATFMLDDDEEE